MATSTMDFEFGRTDYGSAGCRTTTTTIESQDQEPEDLRDHLLWQLNLSPLSRARPRDRRDDHRGDRRRRLSARNQRDAARESGQPAPCQRRRSRGDPAPHPALRSARRRQPHAERMPARAARCVRYQPRPAGRSRANWSSHHLETLARNDRARLCRLLHVDAEELDTAIALVRSLDPKPGAQINPEQDRIRRARRLCVQARRPLARVAEPELPAQAQHQRALHLADGARAARRRQLSARPVAGGALADQEPADARRHDAQGRHGDRARADARFSTSAPKRCARWCCATSPSRSACTNRPCRA